MNQETDYDPIEIAGGPSDPESFPEGNDEVSEADDSDEFEDDDEDDEDDAEEEIEEE